MNESEDIRRPQMYILHRVTILVVNSRTKRPRDHENISVGQAPRNVSLSGSLRPRIPFIAPFFFH